MNTPRASEKHPAKAVDSGVSKYPTSSFDDPVLLEKIKPLAGI
jgi:hypothetical protein